MASSFKNFFKPSNVGNQILPQGDGLFGGNSVVSQSTNRYQIGGNDFDEDSS